MSDQPIVQNVVQTFYDRLAPQYDRFYQDWDETVCSEARFLQGIFSEFGFDASAKILDCACGVGTQAIGLAALGYDVTGSDLSAGAVAEAKRLGLHFWIYDEYNWPSGIAGGKVLRDHPEFQVTEGGLFQPAVRHRGGRGAGIRHAAVELRGSVA